MAGIGVMLMVLNLRAMWRTRSGRRSSQVGAEAERWLVEGGDRRDT
jgi:hypothetical protein